MRTKGIMMAALIAAFALPAAAKAENQEAGSSTEKAAVSSCKGSSCEAQKEKRKEMAKKFLGALKAKNPAKFEELMKLRETDKEAFRAEVKKMIKEHVQKRKEQKSQEGKEGSGPTLGKAPDIKS